MFLLLTKYFEYGISLHNQKLAFTPVNSKFKTFSKIKNWQTFTFTTPSRNQTKIIIKNWYFFLIIFLFRSIFFKRGTRLGKIYLKFKNCSKKATYKFGWTAVQRDAEIL